MSQRISVWLRSPRFLRSSVWLKKKKKKSAGRENLETQEQRASEGRRNEIQWVLMKLLLCLGEKTSEPTVVAVNWSEAAERRRGSRLCVVALKMKTKRKNTVMMLLLEPLKKERPQFKTLFFFLPSGRVCTSCMCPCFCLIGGKFCSSFTIIKF